MFQTPNPQQPRRIIQLRGESQDLMTIVKLDVTEQKYIDRRKTSLMQSLQVQD